MALCIYEHGTIQINGGDLIYLPRGVHSQSDNASTQFMLYITGDLIDPVITFSKTDSFFVEYVELSR